jgi:hypothetical protein
MVELVNSLSDAFTNIEALQDELESLPELANRLGQAHAFYVMHHPTKGNLFGFSKRIGYDVTGEEYLRNYNNMTGINTEHHLKQWFSEVKFGTPQYSLLIDELTALLAKYGKTPRKGAHQSVRIMVPKPELNESQSEPEADRSLLELLFAVSDMLPLDQRLELRDYL